MARDIGDVTERSEVTDDYLVRIVDNPNSEFPVEKLIPGSDVSAYGLGFVDKASGLVGGTDVSVALASYMTAAAAAERPLIIPAPANGLPYLVSAILSPPSGSHLIFQQGAVLDFQTDHTATGIGLYIGHGTAVSRVRVDNLRCISSNASARNGVYGLITVFNSSDIELHDCWVGASTANYGGESTGIFLFNVSNFKIIRPRIQNTLADGIHISRGSINGLVDSPVVIGAKDDGIGIVSVYQDGGAGPIYGPCENIEVRNINVSASTIVGSGVALVGAKNCSVIGGVVNSVPAQIVTIGRAAYGGNIDPVGNRIIGIRGTGSASLGGPLIVSRATDTVISGCILDDNIAGIVIADSANTVVSACRIDSTGGASYGVYENAGGTRTNVTGCILHGNAGGATLFQGTGVQSGNIVA